ncbi:MAG: hypothetical protein JXA61_01530 [Bacteroidales bacterium]|nr:hypothetical protein [Bacteroidales bacterium]
MIEVKKSVKNLITGIYELHKRINFNNHRIHQHETEGDVAASLRNENDGLRKKIWELQKKLKESHYR